MNQSELDAKKPRRYQGREKMELRKSAGSYKIATGSSAGKHVTGAKRGQSHMTLMRITIALLLVLVTTSRFNLFCEALETNRQDNQL